MKVPQLDLSLIHAPILDELQKTAADVIQSGRFIGGPAVEGLEKDLCQQLGIGHAVAVSNGTDAIVAALQALGVSNGDEVLTSAFTFFATAAAIVRLGAKPVFVDIDPITYGLKPERVYDYVDDGVINGKKKSQHNSEHTKARAILPVHLYGRMADMGAIMALAERHGLPVIEDCAQAHGARLGGRRAGSIGAVGCFSFFPSKNLGALGDGGALVTNDGALAAKLRKLREYGWAPRYHLVEPHGINSRLDELQAALLGVKLAHLDAWNARRQAIARRYDELLADADLVLPEHPGDDSHVWHLYVVRSPARDRLLAALHERGVGSVVHYPLPAHLQPIYAGLAEPGSLPVTERLAGEVLSLPLYPELTDDEVEAVAAAVSEAQVA